MKITKQVIVCIVVGIAFIFFGTSTQDYFFEGLAVVMFVIAYILADWDDLFPKKENKTKIEVK